jgi:hypothetical protein
MVYLYYLIFELVCIKLKGQTYFGRQVLFYYL